MELNDAGHLDERNTGSRQQVSALGCIKYLIIVDLMIRAFKMSSTLIVLYIEKDAKIKVPLKTFLFVYLTITIARSVTFVLKNRAFFRIDRIPDFRDNPDIVLFSNFIEALHLFWYLLGFHWLQECDECKHTHPLLYYLSALWVGLGFFMFIAPLMAIIVLLLIVHFYRQELKVINYREESDIPDDTYHCTICFELYELDVPIKFLPCEHHFHSSCVDEWLNLKDTCPLCKKNINLLYDIVDPPESEI
ncbi:E3 ubiquitin-protein ligase [Nosema bombycis CQ1]|uniref:RING-type E3 ubiquitin transferase n=1 Tax=Nosema bombycis (strain CQ1 / CVCC 102059) TaxID=578461 RepID=R0KTT3_NOSB1|nr:E3 ubiquitin-protein ligase [Nosema bombycis CQ1]|eukprot:EOB13647.1 E3 ubiquitin-protein ligase [Nosema bombycis CQ1]